MQLLVNQYGRGMLPAGTRVEVRTRYHGRGVMGSRSITQPTTDTGCAVYPIGPCYLDRSSPTRSAAGANRPHRATTHAGPSQTASLR